MINTSEILSTIWQRSEPGFVFLPTKNAETGEWWEGDAVPDLLAADEASLGMTPWDNYYTPGTFSGEERKKEFANPMGVLYADLDDEFNRPLLQQVRPSLLVETSHGRYQAVWLLSETLAVSAAEDLNKRLSHYLEADHGSWIITKVLRVPGTLNYKRGGQRVEVVHWDPDQIWYPDVMDRWLPEVEATPVSEGVAHPQPPASEDTRSALQHVWTLLDHRTKQLLAISNPPDRSLHLSRLAKRLAECGVAPETIFIILHNLPSNKFRNRPQVLWESVILTAY